MSVAERGEAPLLALPAGVEGPARAPDRIYRLVRDAIVRLALEPRQYVSEQNVAQRLRVSRTPVREAFIRLADDGLLDIYPQLGTFVAPIRIADLLEAQFTREAIECQVARRAAERAGREGVARLLSLHGRHRAMVVGDGPPDAIYAADEATHRALCAVAGLPGVWRNVESAKTHLDRVRRLLLPDRASSERVLAQHEAFVQAIAEGRPDTSEAHMREHVQDILARIDEVRSRNPAFFDESPPFGRKKRAQSPRVPGGAVAS